MARQLLARHGEMIRPKTFTCKARLEMLYKMQEWAYQILMISLYLEMLVHW
jgi:hypothetical protein